MGLGYAFAEPLFFVDPHGIASLRGWIAWNCLSPREVVSW